MILSFFQDVPQENLPYESVEDQSGKGDGWTEWGPWMTCSRSCDGGIAISLRKCRGRCPVGEPIRRQICNMQVSATSKHSKCYNNFYFTLQFPMHVLVCASFSSRNSWKIAQRVTHSAGTLQVWGSPSHSGKIHSIFRSFGVGKMSAKRAWELNTANFASGWPFEQNIGYIEIPMTTRKWILQDMIQRGLWCLEIYLFLIFEKKNTTYTFRVIYFCCLLVK